MFAPAALTLVAAVIAVRESWWALAALPFIYIGAVSAQPNLNCGNGCLAYLSMRVGWVLVWFRQPLGYAMLAGAASGFYLSAFEKIARMGPALEEGPSAAPTDEPAARHDAAEPPVEPPAPG